MDKEVQLVWGWGARRGEMEGHTSAPGQMASSCDARTHTRTHLQEGSRDPLQEKSLWVLLAKQDMHSQICVLLTLNPQLSVSKAHRTLYKVKDHPNPSDVCWDWLSLAHAWQWGGGRGVGIQTGHTAKPAGRSRSDGTQGQEQPTEGKALTHTQSASRNVL